MQWSVAFSGVERDIYEECTALISRIKWEYIKGLNCKIVIVSCVFKKFIGISSSCSFLKMILSLSYELQAIVLLLYLIMLSTKSITGTNVFIQNFVWVIHLA